MTSLPKPSYWELNTADNYEFRVLRTSKEDGSSRALEEIRWTGLKSVINVTSLRFSSTPD